VNCLLYITAPTAPDCRHEVCEAEDAQPKNLICPLKFRYTHSMGAIVILAFWLFASAAIAAVFLLWQWQRLTALVVRWALAALHSRSCQEGQAEQLLSPSANFGPGGVLCSNM
jgi:hypothetical protein